VLKESSNIQKSMALQFITATSILKIQSFPNLNMPTWGERGRERQTEPVVLMTVGERQARQIGTLRTHVPPIPAPFGVYSCLRETSIYPFKYYLINNVTPSMLQPIHLSDRAYLKVQLGLLFI
jgi:hypothetical protein